MKTFHSIFFAVVASLVLGVESSSDTIKNIFLNERRFLLYNSRSLEGNCLNICETQKPKPTQEPTGIEKGGTLEPTFVKKDETDSPTSSPTLLPTKTPTNRPSINPTKSPTRNPTGVPTKSPTNAPTNNPTAPAAPAPECVWPKDKVSAIVLGDMTSGAHNLYKKVAIGGSFINPTNQHLTVNGKVYYGKNLAHKVNYNGGTQKINDLSEADVDWAHLEWLARNIKESNVNGKKVVVKTSAKPNGACYNLYDFNNGGQGYDKGNTLVVFNTDDDLCFTKSHDGRQFGPSILAPFSKVTVKNNAGFVDGIVIAKEFTTVADGSTGGQLQLHGDTYDGDIECIEAPAPSPGANSAPAPDSDVCSCEKGDDSEQSWRCGTNIYACPSVDDICKGQTRKKSLYYKLTQDQCNAMKNVAIGEQCIPLPQYGVNPKPMGSRVCYGNQTYGPNGMKEESGQCKFCGDKLTPTFQ